MAGQTATFYALKTIEMTDKKWKIVYQLWKMLQILNRLVPTKILKSKKSQRKVLTVVGKILKFSRILRRKKSKLWN